MKYKTIELKADEIGGVSGFFSTYDKTPDSYGDIIERGAFTETFKKREETGHPFPLCFNHDFSAVIGAVNKVEDTDKGPYIEAGFLDTQLAQDVRKMLMSGAIFQFSFAYDVLKRRDPDSEEKAAGVMNVLQELEVFEISVVTVPANQNAVATEVKSLDVETKQGRRNRKSDEEIIKNCIESLKSLLDNGDEDNETEDEVKQAEPTAKANEASEESSTAENAKRTEALLKKINTMKGDS